VSPFFDSRRRILAGSCSGISMVSRVRVIVKVTVRDRCVKRLMGCHGMDVVYPWLSNWTCLQWTLHSQHTQWSSAFSAMRGSDALFANDFGEDFLLV